LIDDNAAVQRTLTRVLERAGHTVRVAPDGRAGVELFRSLHADLVITDIEMPRLNGIEVIVMLQAAAPAVPVIAMSGGPRSRGLDLLGHSLKLGAAGILAKPFLMAELLSVVTAALARGARGGK